MICHRACPLLKLAVRRVQNKAENSYICPFEHMNVDYSDMFALSCDLGPYPILRDLDSKNRVLQGFGADDQGLQGCHHQETAFFGRKWPQKCYFLS